MRILSFLLPAAMIMCAAPQGSGALPADPDFVGFITAIDREGPTHVIAVESHARKIVRRHLVRLTSETVLLRRDGDTTRPIGVDELDLRDWVRVWFSESGREEYPRDVTARQVEVVDRP